MGIRIPERKNLSQFVHKIYRCLVDKSSMTAVEPSDEYIKKYQKSDDFWGIRFYEGANAGFVDYFLCEIKVCPNCYFASSHNGHFVTTLATARPIELDENLIDNLKADSDSRESLAGGKDLTILPRTAENAVLSCALAVETSRTIFETGRKPYCEEAIRMATYCIKAAMFRERTGAPNECAKLFEDALGFVVLAMRYKPAPPALYRAAFLRHSLGIALNKPDEMKEAVSLLEKRIELKPDPEVSAILKRMRAAVTLNRYSR